MTAVAGVHEPEGQSPQVEREATEPQLQLPENGEREAAAQGLHVEVTTEDGTVVRDAEVQVIDSQRHRSWTATTDADGIALFDIVPTSGIVLARRGELASDPEFFEKGGELVTQVYVSLAGLERLSGTVVAPDGSAVAGARVIAVPANLGLAEDALVAAIETGTWKGADTVADSSGWFEIAVPKNRRVRVFCGAPGFAQEAGREPVVSVSQSPISIAVTPVYALSAIFELQGNLTWDWTLFSDGFYPKLPVRARAPARVSQVLGGTPAALTGIRTWPNFLIPLLNDEDADQLSPASLRGELPGFPTFDVVIPIRRLRGTPVAEIIRLTDLEPARGGVDVHFSGFPQLDIAPSATERARGELIFSAEGKTPLKSPVWDLHSGVARVRGLPSGTYRVFFRAFGGGGTFSAVSESIEVLDGKTTETEIAFPKLGSIELDLREPDGTPLLARIRVTCRGPIGSASRQERRYWLPGRPFVLDLLPPGDYEMRIWGAGYNARTETISVSDSHSVSAQIPLAEEL